MYLRMEEVLIVRDKSLVRPDDPVVFLSNHNGADVLSLDPSNGGERYGVIYYDSADRACVVPDNIED